MDTTETPDRHRQYPVLRILAPFGAPVGGGVAWAFGRPVWQAAVLTMLWLIAYASWQFIEVWLVPILAADSAKRARKMLEDDA